MHKPVLRNKPSFSIEDLKKSLHDLLETATGNTNISAKLFHLFMIVLILLNIAAVMLETVAEIEQEYTAVFYYFEIFSVIVFTVEYLLRLWVCDLNNGNRIRWVYSPMAVIDLVSILPFYLPLLLPMDLRFLRIVRLFRILRIFKLGRYSDAYRLIARVVALKAEYLGVSMIFVISLLVVASSIMYHIEHTAQPEVFSSIPATMWWAIITLTTVGYGDAYPITPLGKALSGVMAILGIGLFALPAGILASGFSEELSHRKDIQQCCPHCGKQIRQ